MIKKDRSHAYTNQKHCKQIEIKYTVSVKSVLISVAINWFDFTT